MTESFTVLCSDFHLTPQAPREIDVFVEFARRVGPRAARFCVLGDLFEYWVGAHQMGDPEIARVFAAMRELSREGTEVMLFHGNRDFLLGEREAQAAGGRVVGEEHALDLHGRRVLLLHGDSLCTRDVDYQRSKRWLRSGFTYWLSRVMPAAGAHAIARRLRRASTRNVARKTDFTMGIVDDEVRRRFGEGYGAMVCGHVHRPEHRRVTDGAIERDLFVLGDWHAGGIYAIADARGIRLERFEPAGDRNRP